jgi:hypothetical protein
MKKCIFFAAFVLLTMDVNAQVYLDPQAPVEETVDSIAEVVDSVVDSLADSTAAAVDSVAATVNQ